MVSVLERLGASLRRSPYLGLTATVLLFVAMNSAVVRIAKDTRHASTGLAFVGVGFTFYAVIMWAVVPAALARSRRPRSENAIAATLWMFASLPFIACWTVVADGGQQWSILVGLVVSVGLLVQTARKIRTTNPSS